MHPVTGYRKGSAETAEAHGVFNARQWKGLSIRPAEASRPSTGSLSWVVLPVPRISPLQLSLHVQLPPPTGCTGLGIRRDSQQLLLGQSARPQLVPERKEQVVGRTPPPNWRGVLPGCPAGTYWRPSTAPPSSAALTDGAPESQRVALNPAQRGIWFLSPFDTGLAGRPPPTPQPRPDAGQTARGHAGQDQAPPSALPVCGGERDSAWEGPYARWGPAGQGRHCPMGEDTWVPSGRAAAEAELSCPETSGWGSRSGLQGWAHAAP